jgi:ABC-type glycerol-3-phosphate transport system substrate-binding protein
LDDFYNTLIAFRERDVNGNGIRDEVAMVSTDTFGLGIASWFGLGNDMISFMDNKAVSPWYHPNVRAFFTYMNKLYKAGVLLFSSEGGDMAANRVGFVADYASATWNEASIIVPDGAIKPYFNPFVIEAVPGTPARVYDDESGYSIYRGYIMAAIPAGSKNIPLDVKFMDYLMSDEYHTLATNGIEGYNFVWGPDGNPQTIPIQNPPPRDIDLAPPEELWLTGILPGWRTNDRDLEFTRVQDFGKTSGFTDFRGDFYKKFLNDQYPSIQGESILAFPTAKEVDRMVAITTDLKTYSSELVTALIMGEKSIDNWNSYINDLKRLGLDELISIGQARIDRGRNIQ